MAHFQLSWSLNLPTSAKGILAETGLLKTSPCNFSELSVTCSQVLTLLANLAPLALFPAGDVAFVWRLVTATTFISCLCHGTLGS